MHEVNLEAGDGECDEKVAEFTECEHRTAEYEAERSTDITQQSHYRVRLLSFDVRVLYLREKYLHNIIGSYCFAFYATIVNNF